MRGEGRRHGFTVPLARTVPWAYLPDVTFSLPGEGLVEVGLRDLANGVESIEALLVATAAPRLRSLGVAVPESPERPELRLYALLARTYGDAAHSRYNGLMRRMVSYQRALACAS